MVQSKISQLLNQLQNAIYIAELNRFAENVYPPNAFYPQVNFSLLIQAMLVYSTSR